MRKRWLLWQTQGHTCSIWHKASWTQQQNKALLYSALPARKRCSTSLFFTIIWHPPPKQFCFKKHADLSFFDQKFRPSCANAAARYHCSQCHPAAGHLGGLGPDFSSSELLVAGSESVPHLNHHILRRLDVTREVCVTLRK